jgi:UDP-N-acetylmuramyl pentapeptide phosphotransferase/UDP-N-acetylglucosamine-1-phosphate transferase
MYLTLSIISYLLSFLTVNLIRKRFSQHLLDIPNARSSHTRPTPRGGGLGFIIAFVITSTIAAFSRADFIFLLPMGLILIPLTLVGIVDDRQGVKASIRYLVQLFTASIAIASFGVFPQPWLTSLGIIGSILAIIFTALGMTALINFYNFMDGLDGLVASVTTVQLGFLALYLNEPILWLLVAALLGFLWWNWSPAKIFMGDAGSTVLGASIVIALLHNNSNHPGQTWCALAITLTLVSDAIYTLIRRLIHRENIFQAHRSHLYQRLQLSGWSHSQVATTYLSVTLLVAITISIWGQAGAWMSLSGVTVALVLGEFYLQSRSSLSQ